MRCWTEWSRRGRGSGGGTATPAPNSAAAAAPSVGQRLPPTPTPTPLPDCGQTGLIEPNAPPPYVNDPSGTQGVTHPDYAGPLDALEQRDAFRASLPPGTDMAAVNDAIARGCSASWIQSHLDQLQ